MVITLRRSKTDQEASGRKVGLPWGTKESLCPVRGMQDWLADSGIVKAPQILALLMGPAHETEKIVR